MNNNHRSLLRKTGRSLKVGGLFLLALLMALEGGLWLADLGPEGMATVKNWMHETRYGWLAWRLMLYCAVGWGLWKIWHAPGFRPEYRRPLLRIASVSILFFLVCEYSIFSGMGAL
ncbi:hypothetical protein ACFSFZ_15680 [Mixta tenebrionis]|jgi:hypothetical protein|uniref:Uncharacterized protein n=2 Tax=Mixta TaxID=2100764 RepID=A0A6P1Q451_9GAMM|nr:hypothetical protein C7M51_02943 [Mixta intestinalis]TPW38364.1 hypothetical protein FKM52_20490 [Mixta tenebrionis]